MTFGEFSFYTGAILLVIMLLMALFGDRMDAYAKRLEAEDAQRHAAREASKATAMASGNASADFGWELLAERATRPSAQPPGQAFEYRVIQFDGGPEEAHCAIHEVHYLDGVPVSYSSSPATISWTGAEAPGAGDLMLERLREALAKPPLKASDIFRNSL